MMAPAAKGRQHILTVLVMAVDEQEFSALVAALRRGDSDAQSQLAAIVYPELRRLARRCLQGERAGHTLQTTELVHEAWLRLFSSSRLAVADRAHLFALMATQMRRVLVDYARRRNTAKGRGSGIRVGLDEAGGLPMRIDEDVLAIDQALDVLQSVDARACRVVELRFFGGLVEEEIAAVLGISVATLKRDWTFARAWLYDWLNAPRPDASA
jgi:RNA polymerase sigma factor (TIGR02999 family)